MRRRLAPTPGDPAPSPDADKAILAEQLRVLYIEGQRLILTGVAAALILVWVLWDHVPHAVLLGWLAVFAVYSLARAAMARAYRRRAAADIDHRAWMRRVQGALAVGGSIWAAACFLFYVREEASDPRRTTMAGPSKSEYIQWVKGSLNRRRCLSTGAG